ncbi:MAG TPA: YXWGXW repeat-containing protein [Usitatibacter sp.]|nr:YXWGXW repeat-containing protein [Usitatibacter sp.]
MKIQSLVSVGFAAAAFACAVVPAMSYAVPGDEQQPLIQPPRIDNTGVDVSAARPGYIWVPGHYEARGADRRWVNGHFIPTGQPRAITALEADRAEMKSAMANDLDSFHDRHGVLMMTSREPYPVTASNR